MKKEKVLSELSSDSYYEWKGQRKLLAEWSKELGINLKTIYGRLEGGWTIEKTFTEPVKKRTTKILTLPDGEEITPAHLADRLGVPRTTLYSQVESGWSIQTILLRNKRQEKPSAKNPSRVLLLAYYQKLVKIIGDLKRDGQPPSDAWFTDLDACLDRIWELEDPSVRNGKPGPVPLAKPSSKALTLEEADELRRQQAGRKMVINPNFDAERVRVKPDVDNRT